MVPRTEAALPRCKATETCCRMKERDWASLETALTRRPTSAKSPGHQCPWHQLSPQLPQRSGVSVPSPGTLPSSSLLPTLQQPLPPWRQVLDVMQQRYLCMHVASQTRVRPVFQGMIVTPSGLFPSDLQSPGGSNTEGICAAARECLMMLLIAAWREWRPSLL